MNFDLLGKMTNCILKKLILNQKTVLITSVKLTESLNEVEFSTLLCGLNLFQ